MSKMKIMLYVFSTLMLPANLIISSYLLDLDGQIVLMNHMYFFTIAPLLVLIAQSRASSKRVGIVIAILLIVRISTLVMTPKMAGVELFGGGIFFILFIFIHDSCLKRNRNDLRVESVFIYHYNAIVYFIFMAVPIVMVLSAIYGFDYRFSPANNTYNLFFRVDMATVWMTAYILSFSFGNMCKTPVKILSNIAQPVVITLVTLCFAFSFKDMFVKVNDLILSVDHFLIETFLCVVLFLCFYSYRRTIHTKVLLTKYRIGEIIFATVIWFNACASIFYAYRQLLGRGITLDIFFIMDCLGIVDAVIPFMAMSILLYLTICSKGVEQSKTIIVNKIFHTVSIYAIVHVLINMCIMLHISQPGNVFALLSLS